MLRRVAWIALVATHVACGHDRADDRVAVPTPGSDRAPVARGSDHAAEPELPRFGLYVLALTWAPNFCCTHANKEECTGLDASYAGAHLTLHGLWPNYRDDEAHGHDTYPQFCGAYARCRDHHDDRCDPDLSALPAEMRDLGPGYVADHGFLATHEWPKHGSCTGLPAASYFQAAIDAMKRLPNAGTPDVLAHAIGGELARDDLAGAFGVPATSVLLSCDAQCRLSQVSICLAHDDHNVPTTPTPCPNNTTDARYDNGCVTRHCDRVRVPAAGACAMAGDDERPHRTRGDKRGPGGHACNHPGQGPSCTSDTDCTAAGYTRCARSGCCTSQP